MPQFTKFRRQHARMNKFARFANIRRSYNGTMRRKYATIRKQIGIDGMITKLRAVQNITVTSTNLLSYINLRNPENALDWTGMSTLYDYYRVHKVKIQYVPTQPLDTSSVLKYAPLYIVTDQDDTDSGNFTANTVLLQYGNVAIKNLYRPWTYIAKVSNIMSATKINAGTNGPINILRSGHYDVNTRPDNGVCVWRAEGLTNTGTDVTYGKITVTWYCSFKNRR